MPRSPQPARRSYFFGKGYTDLRSTIQDSWSANGEAGDKAFEQARALFSESVLHWFGGMFLGAAGISVYLFGTLVFLLTSTLHIFILGSFFLGVFLLFSVFYLIERIFMLGYGIFVSCPQCHEKATLPHYQCPSCLVVHTRLIPGPYGIFARRCDCGNMLRTSFLTGRTAYAALCAHCGTSIAHAEAAPICIPVIGMPGAGKTCFLYSCAELTLNVLGPSQGWRINAADDKTQNDLAQLGGLVSQGKYPRQTTSKQAQAFRLLINTGSGAAKVLYLYDSAGEAFLDGDALNSHRFYGYCHGFAMVIDARVILKRRQGIASMKHDPEEAFVRMLQTFETSQQLRSDQATSLPLAVVLNKVDDLDVRRQLKAYSYNPDAMTSEQCRDFLLQIGAHHLLEIIGQRYRNARFFAVSALRTDGRTLAPAGVEEVARWLFSQAHPALRAMAA